MPTMTETAFRRMRSRQQDRTAQSDERMTRAAIHLLVDKGIAGTTLAAIGANAGYSRGLVTHRFGSKSGLLAHVVGYLSAEWRQRLHAARAERKGPPALHSAVEALAALIVEPAP